MKISSFFKKNTLGGVLANMGIAFVILMLIGICYFYIFLPNPVTGACPVGTQSIWRFFNTRTTNHRYTPEVFEHDNMAFDPATYQIRGLMTRDTQGGESTIVFSNIRQNTNIPDKTFTPPRS